MYGHVIIGLCARLVRLCQNMLKKPAIAPVLCTGKVFNYFALASCAFCNLSARLQAAAVNSTSVELFNAVSVES